ncbi:MAG: hypothetical protein EOP85_10575, partial [Verrucomicrobiaceae bacterium]
MKILVPLLISLLLLPLAASELDPRLAPMADTYAKQIKAINDRGVTEKSKALEGFLEELKENEAKVTKGGDAK